MRLRWAGVSLLVFALLIMAPRSYLPDTTLIDISALLIVIVGIILIRIDCKTDEIQYINKIRNQRAETKSENSK